MRALAASLLVAASAVALAVARADAFETALRLEPGFALPLPTRGDLLTGDGSQLPWGPGLSVGVEAEIAIAHGIVGLHAILLPTVLAGENGADTTTIVGGGFGVRVGRSHAARRIAPWLSVDGLVTGAQTGNAHDLGVSVAAAVGVDFPVEIAATKRLFIGPYLRGLYCARRDPIVDDVLAVVAGVSVTFAGPVAPPPAEPPPT